MSAMGEAGGFGQSMATAGGAPTADQLATGVLDSLKQLMSAAVEISTTVPSVAQQMKAVRQASMEAMLIVQNLAQSGNEGGMEAGY
jgi:hypothetical protein